ATEGETEDERAQHQLERVRGGAQNERQHADPRDLVDERRCSGDERDGEKPEKDAVAPALRLRYRERRLRVATCERYDGRGDGEVDQSSNADGPGQPDGGDEHES